MKWNIDAEASAALDELVPSHDHGGIRRYYQDGIPPGHFLTAIIDNDLKGVFARADEINKAAIEQILMWFRWHPPAGTWGYPGACKDYLQNFKETDDGPD
jgi:hypothetical protein